MGQLSSELEPSQSEGQTTDSQHEVAIQRGASLREEAGRGGEDPQEIPRPCPRHCREITQSSYWRFGQEKVPGSLRSHCWPVLFPHQEEDQSPTRGRSLLLCQQRHPPHLRHYGVVVSGTPRRRLLPLHRLLRRERLRQLILLQSVWTLDFSTSQNEKICRT